MKKIILLIFGFLILLNTAIFLPVASAQSVDDLFHRFTYTGGATNDQTSKIGIVQGLPDGSSFAILAGIIRVILGLTGGLALASFTYAGVLMVVGQGNEDQIGKAKKMIFWSILALAIIAASYAIVYGVSKLSFFNT